MQHGRSTTGGRQPARSRSGIVDHRPAIKRRPADEGGAIMGKHAGPTGPGASSRCVPTSRAPAPAVRPSRARRWALAGLIGLAIAGDVGLVVAAGARLRARASRASAAAHDAATALRGPVPAQEPPPGRPVDSPAPPPPRVEVPPPAAPVPDAPPRMAGAAERRPGDSMLPEGRPGPALPAAGAADPRRGMSARWGGISSPGPGGPTTPAATAATAWGRSITQPPAWTAIAWADPEARGPSTRTSSSPPASAIPSPLPVRWSS